VSMFWTIALSPRDLAFPSTCIPLPHLVASPSLRSPLARTPSQVPNILNPHSSPSRPRTTDLHHRHHRTKNQLARDAREAPDGGHEHCQDELFPRKLRVPSERD
jgi:hypothetical protein